MDPTLDPRLREWLAERNFEAQQLQEAQDSPLWKQLSKLLTEYYDVAATRLVYARDPKEIADAQVDARAVAMLVNLFRVPLEQVRHQIEETTRAAEQRAGRMGVDLGPTPYGGVGAGT